jgi:hypothetical protein
VSLLDREARLIHCLETRIEEDG